MNLGMPTDEMKAVNDAGFMCWLDLVTIRM